MCTPRCDVREWLPVSLRVKAGAVQRPRRPSDTPRASHLSPAPSPPRSPRPTRSPAFCWTQQARASVRAVSSAWSRLHPKACGAHSAASGTCNPLGSLCWAPSFSCTPALTVPAKTAAPQLGNSQQRARCTITQPPATQQSHVQRLIPHIRPQKCERTQAQALRLTATEARRGRR